MSLKNISMRLVTPSLKKEFLMDSLTELYLTLHKILNILPPRASLRTPSTPGFMQQNSFSTLWEEEKVLFQIG